MVNLTCGNASGQHCRSMADHGGRPADIGVGVLEQPVAAYHIRQHAAQPVVPEVVGQHGNHLQRRAGRLEELQVLIVVEVKVLPGADEEGDFLSAALRRRGQRLLDQGLDRRQAGTSRYSQQVAI